MRLGSVGRTLAISLFVVTSASCATSRARIDPVASPGTTIRIQLPNDGQVRDILLEEYIVGSVLAEADVRGLEEDATRRVVEVQAILARTYALANRSRHAHEGFDLCSTTHCQVYRSPETMSADVAAYATSAASATTGIVVMHNGRPINALFHADCGGSTSDATVAWGGDSPPYLQGVGDLFCLSDDQPPWRFQVGRTELSKALNDNPNTRVGTRLEEIHPVEHDDAGRIVRVTLQGDERVFDVRGEELRRVLTARFGVHSIKSTRFLVERFGDDFMFEGQGFGHGIGLCQRGAAARGRAGHSPDEILSHYYPDTSLKRYY